ncbi:uncharacterized protein DNG_02317 [Cephalotrichum gorgonifer]|uniref:Zn(2)-C6 fungal-type domain-containing protein n=1 Tax=Cephalotrichum gorgonifer TaxID=2041049 RepID=A0AAE8MTA2_9PEZI|nr:uncharacterized protein DNG_02317 [Cephalotrichum gorgonifer]
MESPAMMYARRYKSKSQRPCDFCRRRRAACRIIFSPPCELCKSYERECTFTDAPPPRRKVQPSASVERDDSDLGFHLGSQAAGPSELGEGGGESFGMDDSWATTPFLHNNLLGGGIDSVSNGDFMSGIMTGYHDEPHRLITGDEGIQDQNLAIPHGTTESEPPAAAPIRSQKELTSRPNTLIGATDPLDPWLMRQYRFDDNGEVEFRRLVVRSVMDGPLPVQFFVFQSPSHSQGSTGTPDTPGDSDSSSRTYLNSLVPPDIGARLLNLYFKFIYPLFPAVLREPDRNYLDYSPDVLAAIYMVSLDFVTFDDVLCIQMAYDQSPRKTLKTLLWSWLHERRGCPTLSLLQSALLLGLSPAGDMLLPENDERLSLGGMIVSMANTLGLQHDPTDWDLPAAEIALRRRLSCLVRANDTWLAASTGRPGFIASSNWLVEVATAADDQEGVLQDFVRFTQISRILRVILDDVYSLSASHRLSTDFRQTLSVTQPIMENLSAWYQQLPRSGGSPRDADSLVNVSSFLHLAYHSTKALLFRAIMRPFHNDQFINFGSLSAFALQPQMAHMLFMTSHTDQEALENKNLVMQSRQLLRLRSMSFDSLKLALIRADSTWWRGLRETIHLSAPVERSLESGDTASYVAS